MRDSGVRPSTFSPAARAALRTFSPLFSPTHFHEDPQNYWNEITQTAALAHDLTTARSARLFALLNLTLADGVIAFYDAKYTYDFWRPVTAIRAADTDNNPETPADPN